MGDIAALQYMAIQTPNGCVELWNQARFQAYMRGGMLPAGWTINASPCDGLTTLLQGDDPAPPQYFDPETDDAPWWDPHPDVRVRARRFAGMLPVAVAGLDDATDAVDVVSTIDGGAVFVNRRDVPREIAVRALLVGQDCCAVRYGLEWLKLALADAACDGAGGELTYLSCCPPAAAEDDFCADSTGDCDPETDPDCIEIDCEDEPDVYDLAPTEWWRSLIGVAPSQPVRVTNRYGPDCGCGGSEVLEVAFAMTTGNPRPWRGVIPAAERVLFTESNRRPTYRFRRIPKTTVARQVTRERKELKAVLHGNRWCPVGRWSPSEAQAFGGEGYVTITEAVASTADDLTPTQACVGGGNPKRARQMRLIFDEWNNVLWFQTIRWRNNLWNTADPLAAIPCDTPIEVVELVRVRSNGEDPPAPVTEVSQPQGGDDCCYVGLSWVNTSEGTWAAVAGPNEPGTPIPWDLWGAEGGAPGQSGWPPVGCNVVVARNCPPVEDACPDSVDCQITLNADGTWSPVAGTPAYNSATFPPVQCRYTVAGQLTDPVAATVNEVVYGSCPQGCEPEVDPLADPSEVRFLPPTPPRAKSERCLPATRVEAVMWWEDHRSWDTVVPIVEFHSGRLDAVGVEILVWANPLNLNPNDPASRPVFLDCNACGIWSLSRVPAGTTVRVDGRSRRVVALVPGGRAISAGQLLENTSNRAAQWPEVDGCGVVAAVRVGANTVDFAESWASLYVTGSGS